jgi:predicted MFS family arabinose efflux permease
VPHGDPARGMSRRAEPASFPYAGFLVLAAVIVLAVTTETMPTGLLPDMAASLGVSRPSIGVLVTVYALTVAAVSIPLIRLTRTWPRHALLAAAVVELGLSVILSAASPDYGFLVATRVLGGLGHAVFWATIGAYPGHAVAREHLGRAVGITLGGSTVGFVFGLPLATAIGHSIGWRPTFVAVGAALVVAALAVWRLMPPVRGSDAAPREHRRRDPSVVPVLIICLLALVAMTGHYAFYTYIAAYARDALAVPAGSVGLLLLGNGLAGAAGLLVATTVLARRPLSGMAAALAASAAAVALFALCPGHPRVSLPAMLGWSLAFGLIQPLMQTHLLAEASSGFRDAGNAMYTATFSVGIGGGALVGALWYGGIGLRSLPWVDVAGLMLSVALVSVASGRMRAPRPAEDRSGCPAGQPS